MTEPRKRKYLTNLQLITCIVERGRADEVVKAAMRAGAPAATIHFARGSGIRERLMVLLKVAISPEKEVIDIVAAAERADAIFEAMIEAGQMDLPGKGFIYMTPVTKAVTHIPTAEEEAAAKRRLTKF
ncbi:MAG: P-II family nitrogen regulator [Acidobacteria bacterium]|nr:P-II family nitrogen regulator [Acidobacteriota bacterium]